MLAVQVGGRVTGFDKQVSYIVGETYDSLRFSNGVVYTLVKGTSCGHWIEYFPMDAIHNSDGLWELHVYVLNMQPNYVRFRMVLDGVVFDNIVASSEICHFCGKTVLQKDVTKRLMLGIDREIPVKREKFPTIDGCHIVYK